MTDINAKWIVEAIDRNTKAIEALVEESKPRWVQFERYWTDDAVIIDAKRSPVIRVRHPKKDETLSVVVVNGQDVKGTLAEVMEKLRGDK